MAQSKQPKRLQPVNFSSEGPFDIIDPKDFLLEMAGTCFEICGSDFESKQYHPRILDSPILQLQA